MIWAITGVLAAVAVYMLLQFFANADRKTIKNAFKIILIGLVGFLSLAVLALAIMGRAAFLPILFATIPALWRLLRAQRVQDFSAAAPSKTPMTRSEAFEILGLEEGASADDINQAYKKLMAQVHPDKGGNDWMASKLNEARSLLLD